MTRPQVRRVLSFLTPGNIIFTVCFDAYQYPLSDMCIIGRERARELNKRVHIASSRPPAQPLASSLSFSRHVGRIFPTVAWQVRFTLHQVTYAPWVETWTILVLPQCGAFQISTMCQNPLPRVGAYGSTLQACTVHVYSNSSGSAEKEGPDDQRYSQRDDSAHSTRTIPLAYASMY